MVKNLIFQNWTPAIFCTVLVLIKLYYPGSQSTPFIWMPMVFLFAGNVTYQMVKKIQSLEAEVAKLSAPNITA